MITLAIIFFGASTLQINQIMTDQERDAMGLGHATIEERTAFEQWVTNWTQRVVDQAPTHHPSQPMSEWVSSWPHHVQPRVNPQSQMAITSRKTANSVLFRNYNGKEIELKDGSRWKVVAYDVAVSQYWHRGDLIVVEKSEDDLHPFILKNVTTSTLVKVDLLTPASHTGQRKPDLPSYFTGSTYLQNATPDGISVQLQNGTNWKIAPEDQYRVATWKAKDRIKVVHNEQYLYSYTLKNLDSGEDARADKKN